MFLNLKNLVIWFKAQCIGFNSLPQKEIDIIVEFRDCLCNLMLNRKLYPDNSSQYLEHLFILIRNIISSDKNEDILNKTILEKILSFQDLLLTEKNDLECNYKYLLSEFMRMIKKSENQTEIINYFYNCIHLNQNIPKIYLCLLENLYINNLIIDLNPENQWDLIDYFSKGFSTKWEFNLENIDSKIYQILVLSIIDLYYLTPFENAPLSMCPFSSFLINVILSSIVCNNREKIISFEIKEDRTIFDCKNFTANEIEVKLFLFSLCTKLIIKGINKLNEIENKSKLINEINDSFEKIKCVLFKIADSNQNTVFFQRIFDYTNETCTLFLEIYKLRIRTNNENNRVDKINCISSSNNLTITSKEFNDEGGSLRGLVDLTLAILSYHKNCFVFRVLNEMILDKEFSSQELKAILQQIMNSLNLSSSTNIDNKESINECFYYGLIRVILILYNISTNEERKNIFLDENFCRNFQNFCGLIQKENLIYIRKIFYPENNRLICEMIFEILIEMYEFSENDLFLLLLGDIFLVKKTNPSKKINDYVNEFTKGNESIKKDINTLFYFLDCGKIKNHPANPSRKRITEIEEALIGNQNDKIFNVNYTIFFLDKILIYIYHEEKKRIKLCKVLNFINNILYDEICYLKKETSKSRPVYFTTNIKNWLYSQTRKIIEDKKKKTYHDVEIEFRKIYEKNVLGCPLFANYKVFTSSTFLHQNRAGSETSDSSGNNNGSIFSVSSNHGKLDSNGSLIMLKGRTTSSPGGKIERSATSSDFPVDDSEFVINIQESGIPLRSTERTPTLKEEKGVMAKLFKKEEKTKKKKEETQRIPSFANDKIRIESFDEVHHNTLILCPKKQLLLTKFGIYFKDVYFESKLFKIMKQKYICEYKPRAYSKLLNFPTKLKNFSNFEEPPLFLKLDSDFFTSEFFPISHPYFTKLVNPEMIKKIPFVQRKLNIQNVIKRFKCELINVNGLFGQVTLTNEYIFFEDIENDPRKNNNDPKQQLQYVFSSILADSICKKKQFIIFFSEIEEILVRRFLYLWQAIEIFCKDGKSYFINFMAKEKLDDFLQNLSQYVNSEVIVNEKDAIKKMKKIQSKWVKNELTTYEYLLKVNKYGTRSYKEPGQYPVFPWLLLKYNDLVNEKVKLFSKKDEVDDFSGKKNMVYEKASYRDMKYPINLQTPEKREAVIKKFNESVQEGKFGSHLGTHYSTSSYISYYLMRLIPYMNALILLQNKAQENPNRMFDSILNTLIILDSGSDSRELIPEFFTNIEFMINLNCAFFGYKSNKKLVDDVISKNNTIQDYTRFLLLNKKLLNHDIISKKITYWLDYVFGVYQISNKPESCNTYAKSSYAQKVNLEEKLNKAKVTYQGDAKKIYQHMLEKISVIVNFGQSPYQIFKAIHPKIEILEEQNKDDFYILGMELSTGSTTVTNNSKIVWFTIINSDEHALVLTSKKELILLKKVDNDLKNMRTFLCHFKFLPSITKKEKNSIVRNTIQQVKENYGYYNSLEYSVIHMKNFTTFITCRYLDNSFKVHCYGKTPNENKLTSIMTEDFVNAIAKIDETNFLIGLNNGKLMHWEISSNPNSSRCIERKFVICHESKIKAIEYNKRVNIVITAGSDNMVYIRKAYDFELLTSIRIESKYNIIECKLSNLNFLYVLVCNDKTKEKKKAIIGYTLNGIRFGKSEEYHFSNIQFTKSCNIISGELGENRAIFLWGYDLTKMGEIELDKQNKKKKNEGKLTWIKLEKSIVYYSEQNGKLKQFDVQVEKERPELFE